MSLPLVFQAGVRDEIDEAYTWLEDQQRGLGEEFLAEVRSVLDRIEPQRIVIVAVHQPPKRSQAMEVKG